MKFGIFDHLDVTGRPLDVYYEERLKIVELFDRAGFYSYHIAEHHSTPLGMAPSPNIFLTAVARHTRTLRLGPLVYALPMYHPLRLVQEICMLDQLSGGRLDIGFGRGASPIEAMYFGNDHKEAEPVYREYLDLILRGLADGRLDGRAGDHVFDDVPLQMGPYQKPHPPLWYGVHSPDSAERAARMGSNIVSLDTAPQTRELTDRFREVWAGLHGDAGAEPLMGLGLFVVVGESDAAALALARRAYPVWHDSFNYLFRRHGTRPVHQRPPDWDGIAAEGRAIAGSPDTVTEFLETSLSEAGVNYLLGQFTFGDMSLAETTRSVELFAAEVMPAL